MKVLQSIICVLCVFVPLLFGWPLSAFAVRHLAKGILWTGFRVAAGCLPGCGSSLSGYGGLPGCGGLRQDERRDERPDELSSVLYRLVINCDDWRQRKTANKSQWLSLATFAKQLFQQPHCSYFPYRLRETFFLNLLKEPHLMLHLAC